MVPEPVYQQVRENAEKLVKRVAGTLMRSRTRTSSPSATLVTARPGAPSCRSYHRSTVIPAASAVTGGVLGTSVTVRKYEA